MNIYTFLLRPLLFNRAAWVLGILALILLGAFILVGGRLSGEVDKIEQNQVLVQQNVDISERPFTNVQRETLGLQLMLADEATSSQQIEMRRVRLARSVESLQTPRLRANLSPGLQREIDLIVEQWENGINPTLQDLFANSGDAALREDAIEELDTFEIFVNRASTNNEITRKQAAGELNASNLELLNSMQDLLRWMAAIGTAFVIFVVLGAINISRFIHQREKARQELEQLNTELESRVSARTRDLQVAADVSRQITHILDQKALLNSITTITRDNFDLYGAFVFLYDETSHTLLVGSYKGAADAKVNTREMITLDAHPSIMARAARERKMIVVGDVSASADYLPNDGLPETRSEMAIPMLLGDTLVGVFDLQSKQADRFTKDDAKVFQQLADQITVAIRNAELYTSEVVAREAAEQANLVKSQFLANMSHELRTPLNAILNFTGFVADGDLGEVNQKQADVLNKALRSGEHLLHLINDVLDLTKIEVGMMYLFVQDVNLNEMLNNVVAVGQGLLSDQNPNVTLHTDIDPDLPIIQGDRRRLRQIFLNLISNAVKFTPDGTITLTARRDGEVIRISVSDTGIGIAPEDRDKVFETFRQAAHELDVGGSGLGMPISKHFAEAHNGTIWFESEPGVKTTFFVELPVETNLAAKSAR